MVFEAACAQYGKCVRILNRRSREVVDLTGVAAKRPAPKKKSALDLAAEGASQKRRVIGG